MMMFISIYHTDAQANLGLKQVFQRYKYYHTTANANKTTITINLDYQGKIAQVVT